MIIYFGDNLKITFIQNNLFKLTTYGDIFKINKKKHKKQHFLKYTKT